MGPSVFGPGDPPLCHPRRACVCMWIAFLASLDAGFGQRRQLEADIVDADNGEGRGRYSGVRVEGADASRMRSGFLDMMRQLGDQAGITVEEADFDGRAAIVVSLSPEQPLVFLTDGDTMHGVDAPEEVLAAFVEALPRSGQLREASAPESLGAPSRCQVRHALVADEQQFPAR